MVLLLAVTVGVLGTLLITSRGESEGAGRKAATTTAPAETEISRQDMKECLDISGAAAQFANSLDDAPGMPELIALAEGGEGGMTAFGVDSEFAATNADELIGTTQPEFLFMRDHATAERAAKGSDIVVLHAANVVAAAPGGGNLTAGVRAIIKACLSGSLPLIVGR